ncbi:hypothetical protein CK203_058343 [Vitis vinifera]|uniref:Uncharacterized protein n=1 Tax=Vitis vinifera TaxID=29760 RepID=A0A438GE23_VITVI|nr:hypothetical protein CK203_058343 [Vitis vinifera]
MLTHKDFTENRVSAFVCDLTVDDLSEHISPSSVDIITMSQGRKPNSFQFPVSSTPGNLPMAVFHSGHLPHLPILSGQLDRRKKTLTAGKIFRRTFRRRLFPTPTIPEGAPGGDLQLL